MTPSRRPDSFYSLGVRPPLAAALAERGIVEPFPIQAASLPDSLAGRDVLGRGRTGSGKTVAFALPLIERVLEDAGERRPGQPRALVLVPTRELAVQVAETIDHLAKAVRLRTMTVFGGVRYDGQVRKLARGVDVVVATPGRLEDLIEQGQLRLNAVRVVVLDEADLMADMGFLPPVTRVLEAAPAGQRMLFSATLDGDVAGLVDRFLHSPLEHAVEDAETGPDAEHYVFGVTPENKAQVVRELVGGGGRVLAFARTKFGAERLARELTGAGIPAVDLHGNLRQAARQRNLSSFADGSVTVLVATDIAARGIHVDDVGLVLHVDPPNDPKAFLHRSGRTARAGSEGTVVTLATRNQNRAVRAILAEAKIKPTSIVVAPGDPIIAQLRPTRVERAVAGASIFEPDPEDAYDEPDDRGARSRRDDRDRTPTYPGRDRSGRPERPARRPDADGRPRKVRLDGTAYEASGIEYRPRREPKEHVSGRRGPRPDWSDTSPHRPRADRTPSNDRTPTSDRRVGSGRAPGQDRQPVRDRGAWTQEWWGPEPWEVEEEPRPRDVRYARSGQRPMRGSGADVGSRGDRQREDRSPRPGREWRARADERPARDGAAGSGRPPKNRWTDDDRRKADESRSRGFGFVKGATGKPKGPKASKGAKAGTTGKPVKPGKPKKVVDRDKGKPKPKRRPA